MEEPLFRAETSQEDGDFEIEDTLTFITRYIQNSDQKLTVRKDKLLGLFTNLYQKANELEL